MLKKRDWPVAAAAGLLAAAAALACALRIWPEAVLCAGALGLAALYAVRAGRERRRLTEELERLKNQIVRDDTIHRTEVVRLLEMNRDEMERFRSSLSHSLRMPISIIQGYAGLLEGDMVKDEAARREYLRKIGERAGAMNETLSRQLSNARSGEMPMPHCITLDLLQLTRRVADDLQAPLKRGGVTLQVISGEEHVQAAADPAIMAKVLYNLVENSVKYMGREGIITISLSCLPDGRAQIVFQDVGMGLPAEETEHIFEMNYRGSNGAGGDGHGHGLYMVRSAIIAQGGDVTAKSALGRGMGIYIRLPGVAGTPVKQPAAAE